MVFIKSLVFYFDEHRVISGDMNVSGVRFDSFRSCGSGDIFLFFHVTSEEHRVTW